MTARWAVTAGCLVAAAVVLAWPRRSRPARLMRPRRTPLPTLRARVRALPSGRAMLLAVAFAAVAGTLLAGLVAGVVTGAYGAVAVRAVLRRRASRAEAAARTRSLDALCGLAADLRAGLPAVTATPLGGPADPVAAPVSIEDRRMAQLAEAAWRLAERTGAPIADLIERIEADARAMGRAHAAAAAQAAGARATAWLLAGLPVGGIALGYSIGVDPLQVLLHTPLGAACAVAAIALQVTGLAWADRVASAGAGRTEPAPPATTAPATAPPAIAPLSTVETSTGWPLDHPDGGGRRPRPSPRPHAASATAGGRAGIEGHT